MFYNLQWTKGKKDNAIQKHKREEVLGYVKNQIIFNLQFWAAFQYQIPHCEGFFALLSSEHLRFSLQQLNLPKYSVKVVSTATSVRKAKSLPFSK